MKIMQGDSPSTYAQLAARRIIFVTMLTFAFAAIATLAGNSTLSLQICMGGAVIGMIIFALGGLAVAANREDDTANS